MLNNLELRVHRSFEHGGYSVLIGRRGTDGLLMMASPPVIDRQIQEGELIGDPTIRLNDNEAQMLMNELWKAGVRPQNGEGNPGHLGAVGDHLQDMRKLVNHYTKGGIK